MTEAKYPSLEGLAPLNPLVFGMKKIIAFQGKL